jgi:YD repeat-containing protein
VNFFYDQAPGSWPAWNGVGFSNAKGRLVLACTNSPAGTCSTPQTAVAYSYDAMGRVQNLWECTPFNCSSTSIWNVHYTYDLAGDLTNWTHPAGFNITPYYNTVQQLVTINSSWNDSSHPGNPLATIAYSPAGPVSYIIDGGVSGGNSVKEVYDYNARLQLVRLQNMYINPGTNDTCWVYNYYGGTDAPNPTSCVVPTLPTLRNNNGNVMGIIIRTPSTPCWDIR